MVALNKFVDSTEERLKIRRFANAIANTGVKEELVIAAAQIGGEPAADALKNAIQHFRNHISDDDGYINQHIGVSLALIVRIAQSPEAKGLFPDDILPSEDIVDKYREDYWETLRKKVT